MTISVFRNAVLKFRSQHETPYDHALMNYEDIAELLEDCIKTSQCNLPVPSGGIRVLGFVITPGSLHRGMVRFHSPHAPLSKLVYV